MNVNTHGGLIFALKSYDNKFKIHNEKSLISPAKRQITGTNWGGNEGPVA